MIGWLRNQARVVWAALWHAIFGSRPEVIAVYSDGKRLAVELFDTWSPPARPPHLLIRLEWDGIVIWKRDGGGGY
jgi:hypothetical protein